MDAGFYRTAEPWREDILIAFVDELQGLPETVNAIFSMTQVQLCIMHLIRNSLKFVGLKERKILASDLGSVYRTCSEEESLRQLQAFEEKWPQYSHVSAIWKRNWEHISTMFGYHSKIRKIIYTTNAIETLNSSICRRIRNKGIFSNDKSAMKLIYLVLQNHEQKEWQNPAHGWSAAATQLKLIFPDRMNIENNIENLFTQKS